MPQLCQFGELVVMVTIFFTSLTDLWLTTVMAEDWGRGGEWRGRRGSWSSVHQCCHMKKYKRLQNICDKKWKTYCKQCKEKQLTFTAESLQIGDIACHSDPPSI